VKVGLSVGVATGLYVSLPGSAYGRRHWSGWWASA